jgi:hypothetical protein
VPRLFAEALVHSKTSATATTVIDLRRHRLPAGVETTRSTARRWGSLWFHLFLSCALCRPCALTGAAPPRPSAPLCCASSSSLNHSSQYPRCVPLVDLFNLDQTAHQTEYPSSRSSKLAGVSPSCCRQSSNPDPSTLTVYDPGSIWQRTGQHNFAPHILQKNPRVFLFHIYALP